MESRHPYVFLLEEIEQKLCLVAKKNKILKEKNQVLREELENLKGLFQKKDAQISALKEKNAQIQNAFALQKNNNTENGMVIKLESLIKEVDRCIDLLEA